MPVGGKILFVIFFRQIDRVSSIRVFAEKVRTFSNFGKARRNPTVESWRRDVDDQADWIVRKLKVVESDFPVSCNALSGCS